MATIRVLDQHLANKIAAGEVIERPASVVKELVENALDASANQITVTVKDGGKELIEVSDNGSGMDSEDAHLCFTRHATSKLQTDEDLFAISTLGFRGEALSSIAEVANVTLQTSQGDQGLQLTVEGGKVLDEQPQGMSKGTTIAVRDLFYNTPARKKYLKGRDVELSHITDVLTRYSLLNKEVGFTLVSDGKTILSTPKTTNLLNTAVQLYGKEFAKQLLKVNYNDDFVSITGFVGKPYLTKHDRSYQTFFVNGRYVKSDVVSNALKDVFHTLLFLERHPVAILHITLDVKEVDVNVHPTKHIIRIEKEQLLYQSVYTAIRNTLDSHSLIPEVQAETTTRRQPVQNYTLQTDTQKVLQDTSEDFEAVVESPVVKDEPVQSHAFGETVVHGQVNKLYILCENQEGLVIIDQHAAQERVFFEKFLKQVQQQKVEHQQLLHPFVVELPPDEAVLLSELLEELNTLGFECESYGKDSFMVRQIPKIMASWMDKEQFSNLISELKQAKNTLQGKLEDKIANRACRKAIKAGDELTAVEMKHLVDDLGACEKPYSCPHGRPTIIKITVAELEKKFLRSH